MKSKDCFCYKCKKYFNSLGIASHRAAHRNRGEDCTISYNGTQITHHFSSIPFAWFPYPQYSPIPPPKNRWEIYLVIVEGATYPDQIIRAGWNGSEWSVMEGSEYIGCDLENVIYFHPMPQLPKELTK